MGMNWLAHLYLADGRDEHLLGNLLGDFIGHRESWQNFPEPIRAGIQMHLDVDYFTDTHPLFLKSKGRISQPRRRLAGILIDIFYDYFLANSWKIYSPVPLEEFAAKFYRVLQEQNPLLPQRLKRIAPYLIEENWLCSYRTLEGIGLALQRLSRRLTRPNALAGSEEELIRNRAGLQEDFDEFFPRLVAWSREKFGSPRGRDNA